MAGGGGGLHLADLSSVLRESERQLRLVGLLPGSRSPSPPGGPPSPAAPPVVVSSSASASASPTARAREVLAARDRLWAVVDDVHGRVVRLAGERVAEGTDEGDRAADELAQRADRLQRLRRLHAQLVRREQQLRAAQLGLMEERNELLGRVRGVEGWWSSSGGTSAGGSGAGGLGAGGGSGSSGSTGSSGELRRVVQDVLYGGSP